MRERELRLRLRCGPQTGLYFLDFILSFFVIPISAVVAWTTIYYVVEKITDKYWKVTLIVSCALIHSLNHLCCKFIYRFIKEYVTGQKTFFIVSKIYLYVFAFASTVIYGVVPEDHLEQLPYAESPFHNIILVVISFATLLTIRCRPHIDCFGKDCGGESTPEDVFLFPFRFFNFSVSFKWFDGRDLIFYSNFNYLCGFPNFLVVFGLTVLLKNFAGFRNIVICALIAITLRLSFNFVPSVFLCYCFENFSTRGSLLIGMTILYSYCVFAYPNYKFCALCFFPPHGFFSFKNS